MRSSADSIFFLNDRCPRIHALNLFGAGTKRDPEVMLVISQTEGNGAALSAWFTLCGLRKQGAGDRERP